jgi:cobalamin biosynthesis protein CbiD
MAAFSSTVRSLEGAYKDLHELQADCDVELLAAVAERLQAAADTMRQAARQINHEASELGKHARKARQLVQQAQ